MFKLDTLLKSGKNNGSRPASFDNPLELLESCHEKMLNFSSALVALCQTLSDEGWIPQAEETSKQIQRYFNIAAPEHHLDEEQQFFPAIIGLDPTFKQADSIERVKLINQLIKEHVEADALWEEINQLLDQKNNDFSTLLNKAIDFAAHIEAHVSIENDQLISFAKQSLSPQQIAKMGKAIAKRRGINNSIE